MNHSTEMTEFENRIYAEDNDVVINEDKDDLPNESTSMKFYTTHTVSRLSGYTRITLNVFFFLYDVKDIFWKKKYFFFVKNVFFLRFSAFY